MNELFPYEALTNEGATTDDSAFGEVFTRRWVVEFILDRVGYTPDRDLGALRALEPSCGSGAFLGPMVERLSVSLRTHNRLLSEVDCPIVAFDLQEHHVHASRNLVAKLLIEDGWKPEACEDAAERWVTSGDYLLTQHEERFADVVVGNPPYIRMDDMRPELVAAYRRACPTMTGRTDIYVGFFEVGLRSLREGGRLGFICADRWMRNQYGTKLRALLTERYSLETTVIAHDVDAFEEPVAAYPAITIIANKPQCSTSIVTTTSNFSGADSRMLGDWLERADAATSTLRSAHFEAARLPSWEGGAASWPMGSPARLALIAQINEQFGPLESRATGTRIGIGVASGADQVFVVRDLPDIEEDRLLPMAMSRDTQSGEFVWSGHHLVNPWTSDGKLVALNEYPRFTRYLEQHRSVVTKRNVATRQPANWYRTIDKVEHDLVARAKLLFPDMKRTSHPVLDRGGYYPHHNLYFVVSEQWDLEVLGGLLLSKVAEFFIDCYAVKMRGGTLRFQAQYLRRIRVPNPEQLTAKQNRALATAFRKRDVEEATRVALRVYGIEEIPD